MKKTAVVLIFVLFFTAGAGAVTTKDREVAEKYFNKAVKFYLNSELDAAINVLIRALQKDPGNSRYSSLYDVIIEEKDSLRVIRLGNEYRPKGLTDEQFNEIKKYMSSIRRQYSKELDLMGNRVQNVMNSVSTENAGFMEKFPYLEGKIDEVEEKGNNALLWLIIIIAVILAFILILISVIMTYSRRIKKLKDSVRYLKMRQDENIRRLERVEEETRRLTGR